MLGGRDDSGFSGKTYEKKKLKLQESACPGRMDRRLLKQKMMAADVISFDVFDTLLLRPFSEPADLFYLAGMHFSCPDFRLLRVEAERKARQRKRKYGEEAEVTLAEIWDLLERMTGIPAEEGMAKEKEMEWKYCFANPYFAGVPQKLQEAGKTVIAVSDMYLEQEFLESLLLKRDSEGWMPVLFHPGGESRKQRGRCTGRWNRSLQGRKISSISGMIGTVTLRWQKEQDGIRSGIPISRCRGEDTAPGICRSLQAVCMGEW